MIRHPAITRHRLRMILIAMVAAGAWASTVLFPGGVGAATSTVSFGASADAYIAQNHSNTNYGTATKLKVDGSPIQQSYLRFDVQGLSGTVTRAVLRLTAASGSATGYAVRFVASNSWGEKTITFANAPPASAAVTASSGSFSSGQSVAVDITPLVTGNGSISVALTTTSSSGLSLDSREAGSSLGPQLSVSTTNDIRPTNTSPPTISGTPQQGQTLAADPGTWSGTTPITYAYQWRRCDSAGANCADIAGATAQTYALVAADVGARLRVLVTASNDLSATATSAATQVVAGVAPANSSPPTISGTPQQGQTLAADPGTWSGTTPITYAYQWRRCDSAGASCADIAGATAQTYALVAADVGARLRVAVTASNVAGSASATSDATAVVTAGVAPANSSPPTISGTPQQGQTLAADPGTWSGTTPITYAYQWRRCDSAGANCADIAAATAKTYVPVSADVGSALRVAVTGSNSDGSGSAASAPTAVVTASGSVGYRDQSFTGAGTAPTGSKPESKLWWNDGAWWASMWAGSGKGFHIFRLDRASQRWSDTGVQLDDRSGTRADALWDGTHLYVASHVNSACGCSTSSPGYPSRLYRYSYDVSAHGYSLDTGFPVQINNTQTETLVIDKDSVGVLWATWAQDNKVMISHTQSGDDHSWSSPFVLPASGASNLKSDDVSSLVAFGGGKVGVMWSNQNDSAMYFAYHVDGAADFSWTASPAVQSQLIADDHINLKSLQSDGSGRVFAITKTSLNDAANPDANAPLVLLLVRNAGAGWAVSTVWRISDGDITRPILLIDETNLVLHAFASSSTAGGTIREKTSSVNSISFATGLGTTFVKDAASNSLNNATSTKQNLTRASGLVLLASNDSTGYYWHNYEPLP
jgi:hypothetical protein